MTISNEHLQRIGDIAGLDIETNEQGDISRMSAQRVEVKIEDGDALGIRSVVRFEPSPEGIVSTDTTFDMRGRQWMHVHLMPQKGSYLRSTLENPTARFLPDSEAEQPHSFYQRAVVSDHHGKVVVFDRNEGIKMRSPSLPKDFHI